MVYIPCRTGAQDVCTHTFCKDELIREQETKLVEVHNELLRLWREAPVLKGKDGIPYYAVYRDNVLKVVEKYFPTTPEPGRLSKSEIGLRQRELNDIRRNEQGQFNPRPIMVGESWLASIQDQCPHEETQLVRKGLKYVKAPRHVEVCVACGHVVRDW